MTTGKADALLYSANPKGKPNSSGWVFQGDITPFGSDDSWGSSYLNMRFFVQYTLYDSINGSSTNIDGNGRTASNNNTLFVGVWTAF